MTRLSGKVLGALLLCALGLGGVAPESPVADAAMRNDLATVRGLLADGADINAAQGDGMTALHWAAENGSTELVTLLLDHGAVLEQTTRIAAYSPLHLASRVGSGTVVDALLASGASVDARTTTGGVTPLHFAAASGDVHSIRALLEHGADGDALETNWGQTPLMFAAARGRVDAVVILLGSGVDVSMTATAMDMPARDEEDRADQRQRNDRIASERQTSGAEASSGAGPSASAGSSGSQRAEVVDVNERQRDRQSVSLSHAELVGGYGGLTALLLAVREGQVETSFALLEGGADIDQRSAGDHTPPLLMATVNGHFDLAMQLLKRGADASAGSDAGATPLYSTLNTQWIPKSRHPQPNHYTQQNTTYLELMEALLDAGADPNVRLDKQLWYTTFGDDYLRVDRMGATPFWRAAYALDVEAMTMLVTRGADPSIPTVKPPARRRRGGRGGSTSAPVEDQSGLDSIPVGGPGVWPIHAASGVGYGEGFAANIHRHVPDGWLTAVRYLVEELGADVNARDHNGYNPIHHAAARGDDEMIRYLVERGGDVTAVSRRGQTTADMANGPVQRIPPFLETVALLESLGSKNNHTCVAC